ncbi:MAG: glycosyltransferase family 9 protein, partial [Bdellovibrionota bacterium]
MENHPERILIIKYRALGDSVIGLGTVQYLKSLYPKSEIIYGVPAWVAPLYRNVNGAFDKILPMSLENLSGWMNCWRQTAKLQPGLIYEMFQSGRTRNFFSIYSRLKNIPYFFHNHHLKGPGKIIDQGIIKPVIQRDLDGVYSLLSKRQQQRPEYLNFSPKLEMKNLAPEKKIILRFPFRFIFGVVATRITKMWPLENYVALAQKMLRAFPGCKISIPLSTSSIDLQIKDRLLVQNLPPEVEIINLPLQDLPEYFAASSGYIGNDTGLKHLAVAMGLPTWTFFGPEPPLEWHPYDPKRHVFFFLDPLECRTQAAHYCGLSSCESMICLKSFSVDEV